MLCFGFDEDYVGRNHIGYFVLPVLTISIFLFLGSFCFIWSIITNPAIAKLAGPLIDSYGPFPDANQVRVIFEQRDRKNRINPSSLATMVSTAEIDGTRTYNLFLIVYFNDNFFSNTSHPKH